MIWPPNFFICNFNSNTVISVEEANPGVECVEAAPGSTTTDKSIEKLPLEVAVEDSPVAVEASTIKAVVIEVVLITRAVEPAEFDLILLKAIT